MSNNRFYTNQYQKFAAMSTTSIDREFSGPEDTMTSTERFIMESFNYEDINSHPTVSWIVATLLLLLSIISPIFSMLILGFFQDQPMRNQCVMITLYQDIAKTSQIFIWWWAICGIIVQGLDALDQDILIPTFTIYMALVQEALSLLLFLYLCVIGILRLYTIRFSVLDPTTERWGVSDNRAVLRIRSSLWIFVSILTIVLWSTSTRSIVYFQLVQPELELSNLPTSTLIWFCFVAALIGVCIGLLLTGKLFQIRKDEKTKNERIELEFQLNRSLGNQSIAFSDTSTIPIDDPSERGMEHTATNKSDLINQFTLPTLLYMANGIISASLLLLHYFGKNLAIGFWWTMTLFLINQGALIPMTLILYYDPIRTYSTRIAQYHSQHFIVRVQRFKSRFCKRNLRRTAPNPI